MKILMVSMNSLHFRRWTEQLRDSGHEVFWFDILDQGYIPSMSWMHQLTGWKKGFLKKRGRTFIKKNWPWLYNRLSERYDVPVSTAFAKAIKEIRPDVVHSFVLQKSCLPILDFMKENCDLKWIYSSWGSDLYNKTNKPSYHEEVPEVLSRTNYLITDCQRDHEIAERNGFKGKFLGVFPGGGGYEIQKIDISEKEEFSFLVKGYQNKLAKAIPVLQALEKLIEAKRLDIQVYVFGTEAELEKKIPTLKIPNLSNLGQIEHDELIQFMRKCRFYIGNSISDGMPNTLLEAICMGAFPIQSNPGGSTAEIIDHGMNGLLIEDPLDVDAIAALIERALLDREMVQTAFKYNQVLAKERLEYTIVKKEVLEAYKSIENQLKRHR